MKEKKNGRKTKTKMTLMRRYPPQHYIQNIPGDWRRRIDTNKTYAYQLLLTCPFLTTRVLLIQVFWKFIKSMIQ